MVHWRDIPDARRRGFVDYVTLAKGEHMDERERAFQDAFQLIDLAQHPTLGGITRKFSEVESHVANGGVEKGPCYMVQSERKTDYRLEYAIDLMSCLPDTERGALIVVAQYCTPYMLDQYPEVCKALREYGLKPKHNEWQWTKSLSLAAGSYCRSFWKRAKMRGIWPKRRVANF